MDTPITEEDVMKLMDVFTKVPPFLLKNFVAHNINLVQKFRPQVESYRSKLSEEDILKIRKVLDTPVPELQAILGRVYDKTGQKQLNILSDPRAEAFIAGNLREVEKVLF
ncbi:MAG TPA: hypothetical protein VK444_06420 [Methanobacteriaceae archaeon]|nr:hypothetical protein [Methanobacteriaceae archaeon]